MKFDTLVLISMLCISSSTGYAQTAETFRQPYPLGAKLSPTPNFTGEVWLAPLSEKKELNVPMSNVTFEPGCRNNWHSHKAGQLLIATAGIGYYQEKGNPARRLYPGDIVEIAPDVEHWHGAAPDSWFAHVAITCNPQLNAAVWLQPVSDEQYHRATAEAENRYAKAPKAGYAVIAPTVERLLKEHHEKDNTATRLPITDLLEELNMH